MQDATDGGVRQAELLACLSLAIDLGLGLPAEWMQRTALVSVRLAQAAGLSEQVQRSCYFLALIRNIGCTSTSLSDARLMGNEMEQTALLMADPDDAKGTMAILLRDVGAGLPPAEKAETQARFFSAASSGAFATNHQNHCEGGAILAERLGLGPDVSLALWSMYERWNGKGTRGLAGEEIEMAARVMHVASVVPPTSSRKAAWNGLRLPCGNGRESRWTRACAKSCCKTPARFLRFPTSRWRRRLWRQNRGHPWCCRVRR